MNVNKRGRPKGIKKDERLHVMISSDLKEKFQKKVEQEGSNISVKTCELISKYIENDSLKREEV